MVLFSFQLAGVNFWIEEEQYSVWSKTYIYVKPLYFDQYFSDSDWRETNDTVCEGTLLGTKELRKIPQC